MTERRCWVCREPLKDYQPVRPKRVDLGAETFWMPAHKECVERQELANEEARRIKAPPAPDPEPMSET